MLVRAGVCAQRAGERPRLGLKTVHDVTVHSPLAAVGWPLPAKPPAGAHDDATSFCRAGPVRSRDAGDPLHRPDPADFPPAQAAVRQGHPRVLLSSPREPVRVLGADAPDDRGVRRGHPSLHRGPGPGPGPVRERREQGPDRPGLPGWPQRRGADPVRRRGPGEDQDLAHPAAHRQDHRQAVPVAAPGAGDGEPLVFLRVRCRFRAVL
jgi:hypothetical protein